MALGGARPGAGRKKGSGASHNLEAAKAKQRIVERVNAIVDELVNVLVEKARKKDIMAVKELLDRAYGKPHQSMDIAHSGSVEVTQEEQQAADKALEEA